MAAEESEYEGKSVLDRRSTVVVKEEAQKMLRGKHPPASFE